MKQKINGTNECNDKIVVRSKKYKFCVCDKDLCNNSAEEQKAKKKAEEEKAKSNASSRSIMQMLTVISTSYFVKTALN